MLKFTVDPIARLFTVKAGVTIVNVKVDLYSDAKKEWLNVPSLRKFRFPIRPSGGDETVEGVEYSPSYFFLREGWRILCDNVQVLFALNLYVGSEDGGGTPFILTNNSSVQNKTSDIGQIAVGSGVQPQDITDIATAVRTELSPEMASILYQQDIINNETRLIKDGDTVYLVVYDANGYQGGSGVEIYRKAQFDFNGDDIVEPAAGILAREGANSA